MTDFSYLSERKKGGREDEAAALIVMDRHENGLEKISQMI